MTIKTAQARIPSSDGMRSRAVLGDISEIIAKTAWTVCRVQWSHERKQDYGGKILAAAPRCAHANQPAKFLQTFHLRGLCIWRQRAAKFANGLGNLSLLVVPLKPRTKPCGRPHSARTLVIEHLQAGDAYTDIKAEVIRQPPV
jgi:hypothetical protein